jgi:hypothetical protein
MSDDTTPLAPPTAPTDATIASAFQRVLDRHNGDGTRLAEHLYRDNYELRERVRHVTAQLPPPGATVLTAEQATAWAAYQALGAPDVLATALQERDHTREQLTRLEREQAIMAAAAAHGYHAAALAKLVQADGLTVSMQETIQDGQTVRTALVTPPNGQPTPLTVYAEHQWRAFLPALQASAPTGTHMPHQAPAGSGGGGDLVDRFVEQTNQARSAVPNPLLRTRR